jgi:hypothetical protein
MATRIQDKTPEERKAIAKKSAATRQANIAKRKAEDDAYKQYAHELKYGIKNLEEEFNRLTKEIQREVKFGEAIKKLTSDVLLREHEIVEHAIPLHITSGVYFLIFEKKIVYVGQSTNVFSRIFSHAQVKKFDSYVYMPCEKDMLDKLESLYIHFLSPPLNGSLNSGKKVAPLPLSVLLK